MSAPRRFFGTDGIRGRVGDACVNPTFFLTLGWAIGCVLARQSSDSLRVFIGRDTRISGSLLQSALQGGLCAAGMDVVDLGVMPTPAVAYLTRHHAVSGGIVISASHNPYQDNGIKIFNRAGHKLTDAQELEIEALLDQPISISDKPGRLLDACMDAFRQDYQSYCLSTWQSQSRLDGLKLVVDAAHGAMYQVAPAVLRALGASVIEMGCEPSGYNINQQCGATDLAALQARVLAVNAAIGIAFDGDGDRVQLVDHAGVVVDGDEIVCLLALAQAESLQSTGVVGTLMSNLGLEQTLSQHGIPFVRSQVGDRYVLEALLERGWTLGGEGSGHIIDLDKATTGDGLLTAISVLAILAQSRQSLSDLRQQMVKRPQILKNVRYANQSGASIVSAPAVRAAVEQATMQMGDRGRVLLRLSGTEPLVRVMAEGNDLDEVNAVVDQLVDVIERVCVNAGAHS